MPMRVWVFVAGVLLSLSAHAGTVPLPDDEAACAELLASTEPLFDGTAYDDTNPLHRLAKPLLALRSLYRRGGLSPHSPALRVRWNAALLWVHASQNSETGDFSPVGEHCPDVEIHVTNVATRAYVGFHLCHPMVVALTGNLEMFVDLYAYRLHEADLIAVFGAP